MYHRRRRSHSTPDPDPNPNPTPTHTLAAAAAGTALRHATPTPTPIGSIPTKRMLKRRDSYSSASDGGSGGGGGGGGLQRASSLTERRLRKERGTGSSSIDIDVWRRASTGSARVSMPRKVTAYHEEGEDSSEDYPADDDSGDLQLPRRPFPTTLRSGGGNGSTGSWALKKLIRPSLDHTARNRRHSLDYEDSSASLESIAEDRTLPSPAPLPSKILEEPDDSGSGSDTTARRGKPTLLSLPRHSPPARSASPVKSALKHTPAPLAPFKPPRVSFSDEDSIASFPARARYSLPVFGGITAPSPPPSDSSQESIIGLESALRYPKGQPPLGAGTAVKRLLSEGGRPPAPLGGGTRTNVPLPLTPPATRAGPEPEPQVLYDSDSESDKSGGSIYSDAFEALPPHPFGALPGILEVAPPPPPPPPPPPERLHPALIVRPTSFRPPSVTSLSSTSSTSVHRLTPRDRSSPAARMFASSLRARGLHTPAHARTHSRFSTDSDLPVVAAAGEPGGGGGGGGVEKMESRGRAGSEGTVKRKRGLWGAVKKRVRRGTGREVVMAQAQEGTGRRRRWWKVGRLLGLR